MLKVRGIGETKDLQMWAAAMANFIGRGAIAVEEDTENFIREQVDFPKRTTPRPETPITDVRELLQGNIDGMQGGPTGGTIGNGSVRTKGNNVPQASRAKPAGGTGGQVQKGKRG